MRYSRFLAFVGCGAIGAGAFFAARAATGQVLSVGAGRPGASASASAPPVADAAPSAAAAPPRSVTTYQGGPDGWAVTQFIQPSDSPLQQSNVEFDRQISALTSRYGEIDDDAERQKAKTELAEMLGKQFEVQQQIREEEVGQLEARVKKLRALIDKRKDARQSIIEKRLDQLLREAEGLGWSAGGEGPHQAIYRPIALPGAISARPVPAPPAPGK